MSLVEWVWQSAMKSKREVEPFFQNPHSLTSQWECLWIHWQALWSNFARASLVHQLSVQPLVQPSTIANILLKWIWPRRFCFLFVFIFLLYFRSFLCGLGESVDFLHERMRMCQTSHICQLQCMWWKDQEEETTGADWYWGQPDLSKTVWLAEFRTCFQKFCCNNYSTPSTYFLPDCHRHELNWEAFEEREKREKERKSFISGEFFHVNKRTIQKTNSQNRGFCWR